MGIAQTKHSAPYITKETVRGIVYEVTKQLLESTHVSRDSVDTIVTSTSDFWQGMGCSNVFYYDAAGAYLKDSPKAEEDSSLAFMYAFMRILSGAFDTATVVSITKCSEVPSLIDMTSLCADPFYQRPLGINETSAAALQAQSYISQYGITEEQRAKVVVKNLKNALNNPHAHRKMNITTENVVNSEIISYPLRRLECAPGSDGACAVLLASEEKAKELTDDPVWIKGVGWSVDHYFLGDRELLNATSLRSAAERAYKMADVTNPRKQIDVAEICEPYSFQELLWYEHLGFCRLGEGGKLIDEGVTEMRGDLPVNPSGGVLSTNPYVARGLIRIAEAFLQIAGKAGRKQVPDVKTALAHSVHGLGGALHTVTILGR